LKTQIKLQMHTIYDPRGSVDYDAATDKYPNAAATTICCWLMCNLVVMLQYATFDQQYNASNKTHCCHDTLRKIGNGHRKELLVMVTACQSFTKFFASICWKMQPKKD
jgi:hypothetical protein